MEDPKTPAPQKVPEIPEIPQEVPQTPAMPEKIPADPQPEISH